MTLPGPTLLSIVPDDPRQLPRNRVIVVGVDETPHYRVIDAPLLTITSGAQDSRLARGIVRRVAAHPTPDRIMIALYIDGPPTRRHYSLQHEIASQAHQLGMHLIESFYVSQIGWGSLSCDDPLCELSGPLELDLLTRRALELAADEA